MVAGIAHKAAGVAGNADFLSRELEISEVRDALSGARIVTLTDAPGIGKTSLARAITAHHRDRCVLVELASVTDSRLVAAALVAALGVHEASGQPALDAVVAQRAGRRMLLVLDNCEHLLETCADTAAQLVARCPELHVLATSREPLDLPAERVVHVPPLAVPAATEDGDVETLLGYPSVRLFAQRASRAQPRFALTPYVAGDVAEICRRLDGLPLAIELARPHLAARRPLRRRPPRPTTCFAAARGSPATACSSCARRTCRARARALSPSARSTSSASSTRAPAATASAAGAGPAPSP